MIYLPIVRVHLSCALYSISNTIYFYNRTLYITIFINFNFRGRSYDSDRGGGGGALFENKYGDPDKNLTLNNLSSKYFAIVGKQVQFSLNNKFARFAYISIHWFQNRQFYPLVDA